MTEVSNPLTEAEMREWFNRLINHVLRGSEVKSELDILKQRFEELNERTTQLVAQNEALRRDMYSVTVERDRLHREAEENKALAHAFQSDYGKEQEAHAATRQTLSTTQGELADKQVLNQQLTNRCENLSWQLDNMTKGRDSWRDRAENYERERDTANVKLAEADAKLKQFQELYDKLFKAVEQPKLAEVPQPVEAPQAVEPPPIQAVGEDIPWFKKQPA